ncbi:MULTISPECIES: hypothetical protein [Rhizobium]|uniref:Uncharacterized protein n=1 Tax=Rhizobium favelukesii TaxID=348824 RepID=W6S6N2_9HYPH|nr:MULTISPECIES: hypothetical protein [Rhizobium]MCS0460723.1 hypothetical protein [Rhizobium favelukesii]UFS80139.1 hypothetical protein LPB79_02290 [Rhizobium sp. T136]CDM61881.1 hypothetical protein LPU83_pLPU83d_0510 [Rhizobium favelukesii]
MVLPKIPQYAPKLEDDGTWSITDPETGDIAVVSSGIVLRRLDQGTCLDLVDTLNRFLPHAPERED